MGNNYSVVREQEEEAEFNRLLEDVERAERARYEPVAYDPYARTDYARADTHFASDSNYRRQLGTFNPLTGIYTQADAADRKLIVL